GTDAKLPMYQARLAVKFPGWVEDERIALGFSTHYNREETNTHFGTIEFDDQFPSRSYNIDLVMPVWKDLIKDGDALTFKGELWRGTNVNDLFGGVGQGVNTVTGELIHASGGWGELHYRYNDIWEIASGYGLDDPDNSELLPLGRLKNRVWWVSNNFHFGGNYLFSIRYIDYLTGYHNDSDGHNTRLIFMVQWNF
ncbi:hypothetical protein ACFL54_06945, partial [Planctomycetota bacterium]